jgi:hypothetical protein
MTRYRLKNDLGSCVAGTILWDVDIEPLPDEPKDKPPCPKCGDAMAIKPFSRTHENPFGECECDCQKEKPMKTVHFLDGPNLTMARLEKENADLRGEIERLKSEIYLITAPVEASGSYVLKLERKLALLMDAAKKAAWMVEQRCAVGGTAYGHVVAALKAARDGGIEI